jgi:hypothetical protein
VKQERFAPMCQAFEHRKVVNPMDGVDEAPVAARRPVMKPLTDEMPVIQEKDRPWAITLVCIWWFIAVPFGILWGLGTYARLGEPGISFVLQLVRAAVLLYTLTVALGLVCMIGLWRMKKWSVIGLTILFGLSQMIAQAAGTWNLGVLLPWSIVVAVGFWNFSKLD